MNDQIKHQVLEQVQKANNVLVAVSSNPTVDELSASVGLTLLLNKMGKHATTVFSGVVPSTIEFLQPEKTIETTTDSLRDFIIALDKSKADKLRYKVEDNVVRIFITPYKTSITEEDLDYSQGDFNVDVVVALGVAKKEDLDRAITAHGRILHDATVISLTNRDEGSELGSLNWQEQNASSLCEMVAALSAELAPNDIDGQMATAFMTGIIAETDRFRNDKTTPYVLSLSSKLMASGANQQLIADKLEEPAPAPESLHMSNDGEQGEEGQKHEGATEEADGSLNIHHHEPGEDADDPNIDNIEIDEHGNLAGPDDQEVSNLEGVEQKLKENDESKDSYLQEEAKDGVEEQIAESALMPGAADAQIKQDEQSANSAHKTLTHEKVIEPPVHEGDPPKTDKPFDLDSALQEANSAPASQVPPQVSGASELPASSLPPAPLGQPPAASAPAPPQTASEPSVAPAPVSDMPTPLPQPVEPQPQAAPTEPPKPDPAPVVEPPKPLNEPASQPSATEDSSVSTTLAELEKSVDSPHVKDEPGGDAIQAAQDAVNAAASAQEPQFPKPQESVGSQQAVSIDHGTPKPLGSDGDPSSPPPVPPPMTPQFFDKDGQDINPFLNPKQS